MWNFHFWKINDVHINYFDKHIEYFDKHIECFDTHIEYNNFNVFSYILTLIWLIFNKVIRLIHNITSNKNLNNISILLLSSIEIFFEISLIFFCFFYYFVASSNIYFFFVFCLIVDFLFFFRWGHLGPFATRHWLGKDKDQY